MESKGTKMKKRYSSIGKPKAVPMIAFGVNDHTPSRTES